VATAVLPAPESWEGPPSEPRGGFEHGLAGALADCFGLETLGVVQVDFIDLTRGELSVPTWRSAPRVRALIEEGGSAPTPRAPTPCTQSTSCAGT
jgi:hypothetical protein